MDLYSFPKVTKQFCQTLQIGQINTTSYHLQTNSTLEQWHEEKGDDGDALPSLRLSRETFVPTPTQQAALAKFTDIVCDSPVTLIAPVAYINTGAIRSPPYRVTPH